MEKKYKKASNFIYFILRVIFIPVLRIKYKCSFEYNTSKDIKQPCVILSNHQTSFDQFAVGVGFKFGINFIASDSIFRHGILSRLMIAIARPIPFSKGSSDSSAVKNMFSVIKQGGAVGMFASGNRSFYGDECLLKPGIGKLVKKMGVPVVLVKMRGGFNTKPRWKNKPNKGDMRVGVTRIISQEELKTLDSGELNEIIKNELYFDEFEWNKKEKIKFLGKYKAEFLEEVLFYCPECKKTDSLCSKGNEFFCLSCGMRVKINDFGFFEKINNAENCPGTILEWSRIQLEYIKFINLFEFKDKPLFCDKDIRFLRAIRSKKDELISIGEIKLFADKLWICGNEFPAESITDMAVQGHNRIMIYTDKGEFTVDMPRRANAMKYMISCYHINNTGHYGY